MRRRITLFPIAIALVVMVFQFFKSEKFTNPETGERKRVALSSQQEAALGLQGFQEILATSDIIQSGPEVEKVSRVANRLVSATGSTGKDFKWELSVVRNSQANAFCLPGGKIVVYTGILPIAQNEAGLATVLGHEMAHATSRHGSQRLFQNQMVNTALVGVGASLSLGDMDPQRRQMVMGLVGAGAQYGLVLPFSRDHEKEADDIGLLFMARAGYDPRESVAFWERMGEASQRQPPEFMSTHPSHGTRIERLKAAMPRAMQEYEKSPHKSDSSPKSF